MNVLAFPSPVSRALENARQIVRDPKGLHPDAIVLEACGFLADHGDWLDHDEAAKVRRAIEAEAEFRRIYGRPAPRSAVTLDGLVIWGFAAWFAFIAGVWIAKQAFAMGAM
jgi:hypothetical protein